MTRFSAFSLFAKALGAHQSWPEQWPDAAPKPAYDAIIVGAGGHGLGAAYYLAKKYGITNVAVIEKGWLGGGNTGRNTTIIRSNYLYDESAHLYDHALKLWDGLSQELNYNTMYSKRGVMMLAHNVHDIQSFKRHIHANRLNGVDNEWLTTEQAKEYCPPLNVSPDARHPVLGAALQRRGGTARHDTVAWGYARAAAALAASGEPVTESSLDRAMALAHVPDPDLFIRTGGEQRLSNFLLWQSAYAELFFSDKLWPEFDEAALDEAIEVFNSRERRFGKTSAQLDGAAQDRQSA